MRTSHPVRNRCIVFMSGEYTAGLVLQEGEMSRRSEGSGCPLGAGKEWSCSLSAGKQLSLLRDRLVLRRCASAHSARQRDELIQVITTTPTGFAKVGMGNAPTLACRSGA